MSGPNDTELRVAPTRGAQPATFVVSGATVGATQGATGSLKALAGEVLRRLEAQLPAQQGRNSGPNQAQLLGQKSGEKVAPSYGCAEPLSDSASTLIDAEDLDADAREYLDERAAIAEYDGGLPRAEAEQQHTRPVFEFALTEHPGIWFTMLGQPGDTLNDARDWCEQRFGSDRLVGVRDRVLGGGS